MASRKPVAKPKVAKKKLTPAQERAKALKKAKAAKRMETIKFNTVIAFDPGKRHFAWCAVNKSADVLGLGMVVHTITELDEVDTMPQRAAFSETLARLAARFRPDLVVIERYQQRPGMGGGAPAEFINVMIGAVLEFFASRDIRVVPVTAATWKRHMQLAYDPIPETREKGERIPALPHAHRMGHVFAKDSKTVPIPDHQFDASGIAMWILETNHETSYFKDFKEQLDTLWEDRLERREQQKLEAKASKRKVGKRSKRKADEARPSNPDTVRARKASGTSSRARPVPALGSRKVANGPDAGGTHARVRRASGKSSR